MAEEILRHHGKEHLDVYSAGTKPSQVNPIAIQVMNEIGIDISKHRSKHVDVLKGISFDVVTPFVTTPKNPAPFSRGRQRNSTGAFPTRLTVRQ